jgi:hypothetical protein
MKQVDMEWSANAAMETFFRLHGFCTALNFPALAAGSHIPTLQRKQVIKHTAARRLVSFHIGRASAKISVARDCKGDSSLKVI